ncbi:hypothetical protein RSPO_m00551 (plasmid) [Ralstonia solanacearum Po82]|uniref:Uncharacterized protein n=1 Tax=Ralstonia solanacearum (strain Po82) TaxID=1031711 RepID=F6G7R1_RALS8|nr:hypothetical protein RSPO_m00551 [Ralstonia solanacearum Po82]
MRGGLLGGQSIGCNNHRSSSARLAGFEMEWLGISYTVLAIGRA